jgi:uncharacterized Fe-S cluster-containing radical SAM superfamily protein
MKDIILGPTRIPQKGEVERRMQDFDILRRAKEVEKQVTREDADGQARLYYKSFGDVAQKNSNYRLRPAPWYLGCATADAYGCFLSCIFCWVQENVQSHWLGFLSPNTVATELMKIVNEKGFAKVRISGGEPTLAWDHLMAILDIMQKYDVTFILETNGVLLGADPKRINNLEKWKNNLHVRLSIKGGTPSKFAKITSSNHEGFNFQMNALKELVNSEIECHPAIMLDFLTKDDFANLRDSLGKIDSRLESELEFERLFLYKHVVNRIRKRNGIDLFQIWKENEMSEDE